MCTCLEEVFKEFSGLPEELIPVLQKVQETFGFLSDDKMYRIAQFLRIPESQVYAVATFYAQFRFTPVGKQHVMFCRGTACHVKGSPRLIEEAGKLLGIKEGETTDDLEYSLESVACIGACGLAPAAMINKKVEAKLTPKKVAELFTKGGGK